jgi:cephalosporin-C deacetylase-like acetyl esterase
MKYLALTFLVLTATVVAADPVPQNLDELWADFPAKDKETPLEVEILKTWEENDVVLQLVRFNIGKFKGEMLKLAGVYAVPKGRHDRNLPALIVCHGGGQRASVGGPKNWAMNGYAAFCPNNGAQPWERRFAGLPNTDYGTFNPAIRKPDIRHGKGRLAPGPNTIDDVLSPRNEAMYLRMFAMRRAISFLASCPEVDPEKLGFRGHSTGGVMTVRTATDSRLKAVVPSMGGCGFWWEDYPWLVGNTRGFEGMENEAQQTLFKNTVSCDANWKKMHAPILFQAAANDFNSATDNIVRAMNAMPSGVPKRLVMPAHYNHASSPEAAIADKMWFEQYLKQTGFIFPETPQGELILKTKDGIPIFRVTPDAKSKLSIEKVDIFYSYGRQPQLRFWADAMASRVGNTDAWKGKCPVFYPDEPLFAYANVTYRIKHDFKSPNVGDCKSLLVSSTYHRAIPEEMKAAGVTPTEKPQRLIDDFNRGLHDWIGNLDKAKNWFIETRKLVDPRWIGPKDGELVIDVNAPSSQSWIGVSIRRRFKGQNNSEFRYYAYFQLESQGWNTLGMKPEDFENIYGEKLDDWHKVIVLGFEDAEALGKKHRKRLGQSKGQATSTMEIPSEVSGWDSSYYHSTDAKFADENVATTGSKVGRFRNLRWEGGEYVDRPKHWEEE